MKWSKTKTFMALGIVALALAGVGLTKFVLWLRDPQRIALAKGEHAIAKHLAEPLDMTADVQTPADQFAEINSFPAWHFVPIGFQTFCDVPLHIDGMICLYGEGNASKGLVFPEEK